MSMQFPAPRTVRSRVFISHASEDKEAFAGPLCEELQQRTVDAWLDRERLTPGMSLRQELNRGVEEADGVVIILSPRYRQKFWTQFEFDSALRVGKRFFIVLLGIQPNDEQLSGIPLDDLVHMTVPPDDVRSVADGIMKALSQRVVPSLVAPLAPAARAPAALTTFYDDDQKLAGAALPVTVASLRDFRLRWVMVGAVPAIVAALLTIFALGHLHADWLALTDLTAQLRKLPPPLTAATRELKTIEAKTLKALLETPPPEGGDPAKPGGVVFDERVARFAAIQLELEPEKTESDRRKALAGRLDRVAQETLNDLCLHGLPFMAFGRGDDYAVWFANEKLAVDTGLSEKMLANLQKVVLPILYGVLGSLVSILRHVAMAAASRVFRRETILEYMVRPVLGGVAGFIIGWFMSSDKAGVIADPSVAPFALAFVGGYSIEFLFAALDRLTGK